MRTTETSLDEYWATEFKAINGQINVDEAKGIVECFVAAIGNKDSVGDVILPGAFDASLRRRKPRVVWGHNWNEPIGKVLEISEVPPGDSRLPTKMKIAGVGGLYAKVQFNMRSERGRQAFLDISFFGEEQEWSIGYKTLNADYDPKRQANLLRELELYEVSPVLHGANQLTSTISIKSEEAKGYGHDDSQEERGNQVVPYMPLSVALAKRVGGVVRIRKIADEQIVFDHVEDGKDPEDPQNITLNKIKYVERDGKYKFMEHVRYVGKETEKDEDEEGEEGGEENNYSKPSNQNYEDDNEYENKPQRYGNGSQDDVDEVLRAAKPGRDSALARAVAKEVGTPVKIRAVTRNTVIFDHIHDGEPMTMRASWHAERGQIMVGTPEMVRVETVYVAAGSNIGDSYLGDDEEYKAPIPPDAIPQERFTGDVLRGYGPRRGNLERLLRYWRPIMRKPGGFRRCLVILADHPELYPLENLCAWLHHETTGLWPNEGCHHPGMKNCRRKLKRVIRGSLWSDSQFNERMGKLRDGKKGLMDSGWVSASGPIRPDNDREEYGTGYDEDEAERRYVIWKTFVTQDPLSADTSMDHEDADEEKGMEMLRWFLEGNPEFVTYLGDDENWEVEGDTDDGFIGIHPVMRPMAHDCGCGCGGKGNCGGGPISTMEYGKSAEDALYDYLNLSDELLVKAGRVLSTDNVMKLQQATELLRQVLRSGGFEVEMKDGDTFIGAGSEYLFALKEAIDPVIDYYEIDAVVEEDGIRLKGLAHAPAISAIQNVVENFGEIESKKLFGRRGGGAGRFIPRDGDGDGFFSPTRGAPDKTPVSQLPAAARAMGRPNLPGAKPDDDMDPPTAYRGPKPSDAGRIRAVTDHKKRVARSEELSAVERAFSDRDISTGKTRSTERRLADLDAVDSQLSELKNRQKRRMDDPALTPDERYESALEERRLTGLMEHSRGRRAQITGKPVRRKPVSPEDQPRSLADRDQGPGGRPPRPQAVPMPQADIRDSAVPMPQAELTSGMTPLSSVERPKRPDIAARERAAGVERPKRPDIAARERAAGVERPKRPDIAAREQTADDDMDPPTTYRGPKPSDAGRIRAVTDHKKRVARSEELSAVERAYSDRDISTGKTRSTEQRLADLDAVDSQLSELKNRQKRRMDDPALTPDERYESALEERRLSELMEQSRGRRAQITGKPVRRKPVSPEDQPRSLADRDQGPGGRPPRPQAPQAESTSGMTPPSGVERPKRPDIAARERTAGVERPKRPDVKPSVSKTAAGVKHPNAAETYAILGGYKKRNTAEMREFAPDDRWWPKDPNDPTFQTEEEFDEEVRNWQADVLETDQENMPFHVTGGFPVRSKWENTPQHNPETRYDGPPLTREELTEAIEAFNSAISPRKQVGLRSEIGEISGFMSESNTMTLKTKEYKLDLFEQRWQQIREYQKERMGDESLTPTERYIAALHELQAEVHLKYAAAVRSQVTGKPIVEPPDETPLKRVPGMGGIQPPKTRERFLVTPAYLEYGGPPPTKEGKRRALEQFRQTFLERLDQGEINARQTRKELERLQSVAAMKREGELARSQDESLSPDERYAAAVEAARLFDEMQHAQTMKNYVEK